jgi:arylsulfatase A-like enzyme
VQGAKGASTRYGTNVPLIASWPGKIKPGQVNENLVDFTDMLPTFLDVAGTSQPASAKLDGISFLPQLLGKAGPVREVVFCYYYPQLRNDKKVIWAHDKQWKLYQDGKFYNTVKDVLEEHPIPENELTQEGRQAREKLQKVIDEKMLEK